MERGFRQAPAVAHSRSWRRISHPQDVEYQRLPAPNRESRDASATSGGHPVTVAEPRGMNQVLWMREPNGFFVALEQTIPPPPAPGANGAPSPSYYTGADAGFAVE